MATFENKVVIVTGCSSGIGLATTLLFLSRKALVFGIDRTTFTHELDAAQAQTFFFHQVDLVQQDAAQEAVAACVAKYGPRIDVLANVAGVMDAFSSADTLKDSEWERVMSINLTVPVRLMTAVLPSMKEHKGGAIVNVGSYASESGAVAGIAYTASKHGLVGATKNIAWRFHKDGIRCNAVLPGGKCHRPIIIFLPFVNQFLQRRGDKHFVVDGAGNLGPGCIRIMPPSSGIAYDVQEGRFSVRLHRH